MTPMRIGNSNFTRTIIIKQVDRVLSCGVPHYTEVEKSFLSKDQNSELLKEMGIITEGQIEGSFNKLTLENVQGFIEAAKKFCKTPIKYSSESFSMKLKPEVEKTAFITILTSRPPVIGDTHIFYKAEV